MVIKYGYGMMIKKSNHFLNIILIAILIFTIILIFKNEFIVSFLSQSAVQAFSP